MIRKISSGEYRLYSRKKNPKTGRRRNLGTFKTRAAAEKHERAVQFFKKALKTGLRRRRGPPSGKERITRWSRGGGVDRTVGEKEALRW